MNGHLINKKTRGAARLTRILKLRVMRKMVIKIGIQYVALGLLGLVCWEFIKYMICKF